MTWDERYSHIVSSEWCGGKRDTHHALHWRRWEESSSWWFLLTARFPSKENHIFSARDWKQPAHHRQAMKTLQSTFIIKTLHMKQNMSEVENNVKYYVIWANLCLCCSLIQFPQKQAEQRKQKVCFQGNGAHHHDGSPTRSCGRHTRTRTRITCRDP